MMLVTTTQMIEQKHILNYIGIVQVTVEYSRALDRSIKDEIKQSVKSVVGGELKLHSEMREKYFNEALSKLIERAQEKEADAIIGLQTIETSNNTSNSISLIGTAVMLD